MSDELETFTRADLARMSREDREILVATQIAALNTNMNSALKRLDSIEQQTALMIAMANRWKGAIFVLMGLGSMIGWAISYFGKATGRH